MLPLFVAVSSVSRLQASLRRLAGYAALDLPKMERYTGSARNSDHVDEARTLTCRYPWSSQAWTVRGRCETYAGMFDAAVCSYRRAGASKSLRQAEERAKIARSVRGKDKVLRVMDEGGGYWLVATGRCHDIDVNQRLLERGPSGKFSLLFEAKEANGGNEGVSFGLRRLRCGAFPDLIVESYTWMSNGGECELGILSGSRGHWRSRYRDDDCLWYVPIIGPGADGLWRIAILNWVWYKGPIWTNVYRLKGDSLVETTRRYPRLIRRQVREIRGAVRDSLPERRAENASEARKTLRRFGYRLSGVGK